MSLPQMTHVFNLRVQAGGELLNLGRQQFGLSRHITPVMGGFLRGIPGTRTEGLAANLLTGGSDSVSRDEVSNIIHLDVRTQAKTPTGECVYIQYTGHLALDETARKFMSRDPDAGTTTFGDHDWWIAPRFEFSDPKYQWVERTMFFGRGRFILEGDFRGVEYEIFAVQN
ncbi:hypothetical protein ASPCADRAFT_504517 [Aspergillus carbonarius ITEM 5010]|uniref:DUF3237 domain-containing protein n=1 Tax=Aspergillus carbonarius (strain ITEM 5010) TaxID=602072 RepID=A0A1R3RX28_ASPC5|nr:hypothetical protein ASPCADRAFT_504517 [Aspergillus carbonarius ITEM 5010]